MKLNNHSLIARTKYTGTILILFLFSIIFMLAGCSVQLAKPIARHVSAKKDKAYIYGKFRALNQSQNKIAFKLQEASLIGKVYYIPFDFPPNYFALELDAGRYTIGKIALLTNNHTWFKEISLSEDVSDADFLLEPGKIYYLGDYIGYSHVEDKPRARHYEWQLQEIDNNFKSTTSVIKTMYSPFHGFEVVNLMEQMKKKIFLNTIQRSELVEIEGTHCKPKNSTLGRSLPPI